MNLNKQDLDTVLIGAFLDSDSDKKRHRPLPWESTPGTVPDLNQSRDLQDKVRCDLYRNEGRQPPDERFEFLRPFSDNQKDPEPYTHQFEKVVQERPEGRYTFEPSSTQGPSSIYKQGSLKDILQRKYTSSVLDAKPKVFPIENKETNVLYNKVTQEYAGKDPCKFDIQTTNLYDHGSKDPRQFDIKTTHLSDHGSKDPHQFDIQTTNMYDHVSKDPRKYVNPTTYDQVIKDPCQSSYNHTSRDLIQRVSQTAPVYTNRGPYQYDDLITHDHTSRDHDLVVNQLPCESSSRGSHQHINQTEYDNDSKDPQSFYNKPTHVIEKSMSPFKTNKDLSAGSVKNINFKKDDSIPRGRVSLKASAAVYKTMRDNSEGLFLTTNDKNREAEINSTSITNEQNGEHNTPEVMMDHTLDIMDKQAMVNNTAEIMVKQAMMNYSSNTMDKQTDKSSISCDKKEKSELKVKTRKKEKAKRKKSISTESSSFPSDKEEDAYRNAKTRSNDRNHHCQPKQDSHDDTSDIRLLRHGRGPRESKSNTVRMSKEPDEVLRARRKKATAKHQFESEVGVRQRNPLLIPDLKMYLPFDKSPTSADALTGQPRIIENIMNEQDKPNSAKETISVPKNIKQKPKHPKGKKKRDKSIKYEEPEVAFGNKELKIKQESKSLKSATDLDEPTTSDEKLKVVKISSEDCFEFSDPVQSMLAVNDPQKKKKKTNKCGHESKSSKQNTSLYEKKPKKTDKDNKHPKTSLGQDTPDDYPKRRSQKDPEWQRKRRPSQPREKSYDDDSDDEGLRPGVWGCEIGGQFHAKQNKDTDKDQPNKTGNKKMERTKKQRPVKMDQENTTKIHGTITKSAKTGEKRPTKTKGKTDTKIDEKNTNDKDDKKKTGNRFIRFLRRLFRIK